MKNAVRRLQSQVRALFLETGAQEIPAVTPYRFTAEHIRMPRTEHPYLYLVLDGMLRLHTPSGMKDYVAGQYSVSQIDTPLSGTVLAFSAGGISWRFPLSFCPARRSGRLIFILSGEQRGKFSNFMDFLTVSSQLRVILMES